MWFVYILLYSDKSYYIGISNNVQRRLIQHQNGKGGAYTRSHRPIKIVYQEQYLDKSTALKRESQLKKLTKAEKKNLIKKFLV